MKAGVDSGTSLTHSTATSPLLLHLLWEVISARQELPDRKPGKKHGMMPCCLMKTILKLSGGRARCQPRV